MIPTQAQKIIERSFYEGIRLKAVEYGYTPDITLYPNTPAGTSDYKSALANIRSTKGFAVEIFGASIPTDKGTKDLPRIVISPSSFVPGEYGKETTPHYVQVGDTFEKRQDDGMVFRYFLDVIVSAKSANELRELTNIVHTGLPLRGFIAAYDQSMDDFLIQLIGSTDERGVAENILEKNYHYEIPDVSFMEGVTTEVVSPITETILNVEISHYLGIN
jgi:hypothetical protein